MTIHAAGFAGSPSRGQRSSATAQASWTASSARSRSPSARARAATACPDSRRNRRSRTRGGAQPLAAAPGSEASVAEVHERAHLDAARGGAGDLRRPGDRLVEVGARRPRSSRRAARASPRTGRRSAAARRLAPGRWSRSRPAAAPRRARSRPPPRPRGRRPRRPPSSRPLLRRDVGVAGLVLVDRQQVLHGYLRLVAAPFAAFTLTDVRGPGDRQSWRVAAHPRASGGARRSGASRRSPRRRDSSTGTTVWPVSSSTSSRSARRHGDAPLLGARSRAGPARARRARRRTGGWSGSGSGAARRHPSPWKIGCRAMARVAHRHRHDALPAARGGRAARHLASSRCTSTGRAGRTARASCGDYDAFYEHLLTDGGELPSTSQPSVGDFLAVYEPLVEAGDDIVSIHLSGGISGTVRAAEQARDALIEQGVDPGADRGAGLHDGLRGPRADGDRRRQRRRTAAPTCGGRPRRPRRCASG